MDETKFNERIARLEKTVDVLNKLPPEVRQQAFTLLHEFIGDSREKRKRQEEDTPPDSDFDEVAFFSTHQHDKPSDNVRLIAAYFYNEFGTEPFTIDEVRNLADRVGITIPSRPNATMDAAKEDGKSLFTHSGRGSFKVTVHGEALLKSVYGVKKGTKKRTKE